MRLDHFVNDLDPVERRAAARVFRRHARWLALFATMLEQKDAPPSGENEDDFVAEMDRLKQDLLDRASSP